MAYTIEQMEDAFIDALDALKLSIGVREIKSYQGELEAADIRNLTLLFPAVFVVYGGSKIADHGARKVEHVTFHLFVCDKNLRKEAEARRGGVRNPGTYAMLNSTRNLLIGKRLGLDIWPVELVREYPVWFGGGVSVYGAEYATANALLYPAE